MSRRRGPRTPKKGWEKYEGTLPRDQQIRKAMARWTQDDDGTVYCGGCSQRFVNGWSAAAHLYQRTSKVDCLQGSILAAVGFTRDADNRWAHR